MTPAQARRLRVGDVIRRRGVLGSLRVVCVASHSGRTETGGPHHYALVKIGHSWTDPNPTAWYDEWALLGAFDVTRRRAPKVALRALRHEASRRNDVGSRRRLRAAFDSIRGEAKRNAVTHKRGRR